MFEHDSRDAKRAQVGETGFTRLRPKYGKWISGLLLLLSLSLLVACRGQNQVPVTVDPDGIVSSQNESDNTDPTPTVETGPSRDRQLVVWLPDFAGYGDDGAASEVLSSAFRQFEQSNPDVRVEVQIKANAGQSDMYAYLQSAQRVAPDVLPDLALIDSQSLWHLVDLGLLQPLPADFSGSHNYYEFALDAIEYNDQAYGVPYAADIQILAGFRPTEAADDSGQMPSKWSELLNQDAVFRYAASGEDVYENGAVLVQYVGAGGQLLENGSTSNDAALRDVFSFVQSGHANGVIPDAVLDIASLEGVWNRLIAEGDAYGNVSASDYLAEHEAISTLTFSAIPTRNGTPATIASVWAFVVLGEDAEQRALSASLINTLLDPTIQGPWSQYTNHLPTQPSSLSEWSNPSTLTEFLSEQLSVAVAIPNGRPFADFAHRVLDAQLGVLEGELTPEAAVEVVRGPG